MAAAGKAVTLMAKWPQFAALSHWF